jgi:hypothetical protein
LPILSGPLLRLRLAVPLFGSVVINEIGEQVPFFRAKRLAPGGGYVEGAGGAEFIDGD